MQAGTLNRQVTIQALGPGRDAFGQPTEAEWADVVTVWANIRTLNGREFAAAGGEASQATASIRIRYRTGLTAGMRVLHGATVYNVVAVLPDEAGRVHVDLACTTGANEG